MSIVVYGPVQDGFSARLVHSVKASRPISVKEYWIVTSVRLLHP